MDEAARIVERHARRGCIDRHRHRGPGRRVAGRRRSPPLGARSFRRGRSHPSSPRTGRSCRSPIAVKAPLPAGRCSKRTELTPEPRSDEVAATWTFAPATTAPLAGSLNETVGAVLSTREVRSALVPSKPPTSVATARRSYCPSPTLLVSKSAENGALVSVATCVQVPAPAGLRSKTTWAVSAWDAAVRVTEPARVRARIVKRRRRRVVDDDRANRGGHREAGVVDDDDLELGVALGARRSSSS